MRSVMSECLRVMKPGAHGLVWALPRTSHCTATALEDAGFEIRDCVYHLFGSGFPKSLDVSKAIDKAAGAERERTPQIAREIRASAVMGQATRCGKCGNTRNGTSCFCALDSGPATDAAKQWAGWGTALKPAVECWWLVRKPCSEKTVAANVLKWGTGALNIDGTRIEAQDAASLAKNWDRVQSKGAKGNASGAMGLKDIDLRDRAPTGRFPSHLILDEEAGAMLDAQSETSKTGKRSEKSKLANQDSGNPFVAKGNKKDCEYTDSGGASRFFYCAKVSASERNAGLEGMADRELATSTGQTRPNAPARLGSNPDGRSIVKNHHPTVKPQKLMRYLARLVTPPGGIVLDPFMGSGSTGLAAKSEGFGFIGIEKEREYYKIAKERIRQRN
ncbi:MAG: site-specific DNA-methyltransferase [Candidatus Peribacteraceae bacterium]|nr:site-specific DNA-methyltransferase [Candidatus Peribacteraceae bacterium]